MASARGTQFLKIDKIVASKKSVDFIVHNLAI